MTIGGNQFACHFKTAKNKVMAAIFRSTKKKKKIFAVFFYIFLHISSASLNLPAFFLNSTIILKNMVLILFAELSSTMSVIVL